MMLHFGTGWRGCWNLKEQLIFGKWKSERPIDCSVNQTLSDCLNCLQDVVAIVGYWCLERWSKHTFSMTSFPQKHSICSANEILVPQTTNCTFDHKYISVTFTYLTISHSKMHSSLVLSMWDHLNQSKLVWWFVKENVNSCVQIFSSCSCCTHSLCLLAFVLLRGEA